MNATLADHYAILDTIADAEAGLQRSANSFSPLAYEVAQARHTRARQQLRLLLEENERLRKRLDEAVQQ